MAIFNSYVSLPEGKKIEQSRATEAADALEPSSLGKST